MIALFDINFMKLLKILPLFLLIGSFGVLSVQASNHQSDNTTSYQRMSELSQDENEFLEKLFQLVKSDNQEIDYQKYIQSAKTDNKGIFWYQCAETLSELPDNQQLDIRYNGRLFVSNGILTELLKSNSKFPEVWAQKIIVLNYLVHGYLSLSNALMITTEQEKYENAKYTFNILHKELKETLDKAIELYPNDEWFLEQKSEFEDNFGLN